MGKSSWGDWKRFKRGRGGGSGKDERTEGAMKREEDKLHKRKELERRQNKWGGVESEQRQDRWRGVDAGEL